MLFSESRKGCGQEKHKRYPSMHACLSIASFRLLVHAFFLSLPPGAHNPRTGKSPVSRDIELDLKSTDAKIKPS